MRLIGYLRFMALFAVALMSTVGPARAQTNDTSLPASAELKIVRQDGTQTSDAGQLLESPRLAEVPLTKDPFYGMLPRTYLAVPLTALIDPDMLTGDPSFQFRSVDGFVATVPARALLNRDPSRPTAWIAIEPPAAKWPPLPGRGSATAGPFALIWSGPGAEQVWSERWPYQVVAISQTASAEDRWPQLKVAEAASANVRQGQHVFIAQCMVCHQLAGAGDSHVGPDLNKPMSPTQYFAPGILAKYIRDPASVRDWPRRQMEAFPEERLSDADLGALIEYLGAKAGGPAR
jgi:mono/diheme cytochrome c family protein